MESDDSKSNYFLYLNRSSESQITKEELKLIEVFYTRTSKNNQIACMFVKCSPLAKYTILFSHGKPSEKNLYADVDAAWHALQTRYGVRPENIILYGQSIGTVPTIDLASKYEVGGVILHSPLTSGMRVAFPNTKRTWFFDSFPSIEKVPKVTSPVLVIHGTNDEIIDFSHGQAIYERCPRAVEPLWVEGAVT
ncbi:hypothetical protein TNCT_123821 [Trichonephila clavata]|uniref:Dienelactone hydrolase domain-containing protein n=1 Tax=Trichonephila clavata TaxID=2740835 RepID=A0A8X6KYZ1_TRICU|nr:hypothetical protein TNCT_123821 [Trichonephila clavata]